MTCGEIFVAILTSLIASVVFWIVFNVIPNNVGRRKIRPLLDFDLYQIYFKLATFLKIPLYYSEHNPSKLQQKLYTGRLTIEDYRLYLGTKCLTVDYQIVDDMAKHLMPIGEKLKTVSKEILEMIQKLYVFNQYLTVEQILLCRKIADKVSMYDYEFKAFEKAGKQVLIPVDPTIRYMSKMFYDTYMLYIQLQDLLIKQKPVNNEFGDFYKNLNLQKIGLLYSHGEYAKIIKRLEDKKDANSKLFFVKSMYRKGNVEKGLAALKDYMQADSMRLIYQRGHFEEFIGDPQIQKVLIETRSEEEYQEMIDYINREKKQQKVYEDFAREISNFYDNKSKNHHSIVNRK